MMNGCFCAMAGPLLCRLTSHLSCLSCDGVEGLQLVAMVAISIIWGALFRCSVGPMKLPGWMGGTKLKRLLGWLIDADVPQNVAAAGLNSLCSLYCPEKTVLLVCPGLAVLRFCIPKLIVVIKLVV